MHHTCIGDMARTDGRLSARVDERFDRMTIHFGVNVQHCHTPERLWLRVLASCEYMSRSITHRPLDRMLHVLKNSFLPDRLLDTLLRIDIVRSIRVEESDLSLLLDLRFAVHPLVPHVLFSESLTGLERLRQSRIVLQASAPSIRFI